VVAGGHIKKTPKKNHCAPKMSGKSTHKANLYSSKLSNQISIMIFFQFLFISSTDIIFTSHAGLRLASI
jgi:hypothetical protein